jgi:hypothetical protein
LDSASSNKPAVALAQTAPDVDVTLSDQVSGSAGVIINDKGCWRNSRVDSCRHQLLLVAPGILCPVLVFGVRRAHRCLVTRKVSRTSLDFAGVLVLLLEIVTCAPHFYVLTMCVVTRAFSSSVSSLTRCARRIDETPQFIASALFASEGIGTVVFVRAAHIELGFDTGREWSSRVKTSRVLSSRVQPSEHAESVLGPGSGDDASDATPKLKHGASSMVSRREAVMRKKLLLATKVAHKQLGEKVAMFLGCTVALWVGGLSSESAAKALALVLLEAISDAAKAAAFMASKIDVGHVRFNLHWPTLLGLVLVASWGCLLVAIRINCLIGEDIGRVLG